MVRPVNPQKEQEFSALVRRLEHDRLIDKSVSLKAELLGTVTDLQGGVRHGFLPVKTITDRFNLSRPEASRLTYQRVGRILASMGFRKGRTGDGAAAVYYDNNQIIQMLEAYGLEGASEASDSPVTPQAIPISNPNDSDDMDD